MKTANPTFLSSQKGSGQPKKKEKKRKNNIRKTELDESNSENSWLFKMFFFWGGGEWDVPSYGLEYLESTYRYKPSPPILSILNHKPNELVSLLGKDPHKYFTRKKKEKKETAQSFSYSNVKYYYFLIIPFSNYYNLESMYI